MAAKLFKLQSKGAKLKAGEAAHIRATVSSLETLYPEQVQELLACIDRQTASENGWTFIMLSHHQNLAVVRWIRRNSIRPARAAELWANLFDVVDRRTGEITMTRDQLADVIEVDSNTVSTLMTELESIGAIIKRRVRVSGMKGPGVVRYYMNPNVATHLAGLARDKAQAAAPPVKAIPLHSIEGGRQTGG